MNYFFVAWKTPIFQNLKKIPKKLETCNEIFERKKKIEIS